MPGLRRNWPFAIAVFSVAIALPAQVAPVYRLAGERWENFTAGGFFNPHISGGSILAIRDNPSDAPVLLRVGDAGALERIPLSVPGAYRIMVYGVSGSDDGTVAAACSARKDDGASMYFLVRIPPDRAHPSVILVQGYAPTLIVLAPDGKLWTIGQRRDEWGQWSGHLLKRFDGAGHEVESRLVEAKPALRDGPPRPDEILDPEPFSSLRAAPGIVAWMTRGNEYIEFDLEGHERLRLDGPSGVLTSGTMALRRDGAVVIETGSMTEAPLWALDREARCWRRVSLVMDAKERSGLLLGFSGADLVMLSGQGGVLRFRADGPE